jgi:hypothetical protein
VCTRSSSDKILSASLPSADSSSTSPPGIYTCPQAADADGETVLIKAQLRALRAQPALPAYRPVTGRSSSINWCTVELAVGSPGASSETYAGRTAT